MADYILLIERLMLNFSWWLRGASLISAFIFFIEQHFLGGVSYI
jgi:hypothetical protein